MKDDIAPCPAMKRCAVSEIKEWITSNIFWMPRLHQEDGFVSDIEALVAPPKKSRCAENREA
jgi:hypothetical protein